MTMAGLAAVFWGSMGVAGQYLLQNCHFTPMDLISIRMLLAGSIFVCIEFFLLKRGALKVFETKQNIIDLIIYTLTIIGTQLTFFVCIQYANAPFAAVLTATVPLWIMLFMFVFQHKHLTVKEIFCGIVAVAGVVLVVTGGSFKNFNVSGIGFLGRNRVRNNRRLLCSSASEIYCACRFWVSYKLGAFAYGSLRDVI